MTSFPIGKAYAGLTSRRGAPLVTCGREPARSRAAFRKHVLSVVLLLGRLSVFNLTHARPDIFKQLAVDADQLGNEPRYHQERA